jgi:hypothetical protein
MSLIDILPPTDLHSEIHDILMVQREILESIICDNDFGFDNLECFHNHLIEVNDQIERIKHATQKR